MKLLLLILGSCCIPFSIASSVLFFKRGRQWLESYQLTLDERKLLLAEKQNELSIKIMESNS